MSVEAFAAAFPFEATTTGAPARCSSELLLQLGMPGTDSLTIWYARGLTDPEPPELGGVLRPDGRPASKRVEHIVEGQCGVFQISGLAPDTPYQVQLVRGGRELGTLSARTAPTTARPFSLLAFSCYAPFAAGQRYVEEGNSNSLQALQRAALRPEATRPAFALGMGDQVYVDDGAWRPFRAPAHSLLRGARGAQLAYPPDAADAYFDRLYRAHFSLGEFARSLTALPSAMIWDDHEIRAGWGTLGDEADPRWREHATSARKHFLSYQLLRSARYFKGASPFGAQAWAPDAQGRWPSLHYNFDWGPQATFFVMDQRSQRAGKDGVLGDPQRKAIEAWLDQPRREPRLYVLVSPIPLTTPGWFRVDPMGWTSMRRDERGDRWWAEASRSEAHWLLERLAKRFGHTPDRLLILSGDVHYSDVRELRLPRRNTVFGHEVISSGLAQSRYQTWNRPFYELDEWRPAFSDVLASRSLGRHLGSGFAELHLTPGVGEAPTVRVLFHLGASRRESEIKHCLGIAKTQSWPEAQPRFELDPARHGALLDTKPRSSAAEGPVRSSLRALGSDRVGAVIGREQTFINERRDKRTPSEAAPLVSGDHAIAGRAFSGIALSGGGIRSATVCIGFMQVLQEQSKLTEFDYVSSVSGGSFANGYLQVMSSPAVLKRMKLPTKDALTRAFSPEAVERLYEKSRYLARGNGLTGLFNTIRLATSFGTSLIQHWLWLGSVLLTLGYAGLCFGKPLHDTIVGLAALGAGTVLIRALLAHDFRGIKVRSLDDKLNVNESLIVIGLCLLGGPLLWTTLPGWFEHRLIEFTSWAVNLHTDAWGLALNVALVMAGALLLSLLSMRELMLYERLRQGVLLGGSALIVLALAILVAYALHLFLASSYVPYEDSFSQHQKLALSAAVTVVLTLITSPNSTSLHRYYAERVADTFLYHARAGRLPKSRMLKRPLLLNDLTDPSSLAPYPLFNGCVNLVGKDPEFAGDQTSDYFVFAPHHCGAKLIGYASTEKDEQYGQLTLSEAVTCSGAAISPFQGRSMPSATSILLWLLNLRTDLWLPNPGRRREGLWGKLLNAHTVPWGPLRQLFALGGKLDTHARFVNVSDGGFIDNLGVYELLRRRCQCIVAIDATWDPRYEFEYLRNLITRARQELKVEFSFEEEPEKVIKPRVKDGLSGKCLVVARIKWPEPELAPGTLYFVKAALSSERAHSTSGLKAADPSRAYATYHPSFPQESTGDQFFDPVQSRAYHELGRQLAEELLQHQAWRPREFPDQAPSALSWQAASAVAD